MIQLFLKSLSIENFKRKRILQDQVCFYNTYQKGRLSSNTDSLILRLLIICKVAFSFIKVLIAYVKLHIDITILWLQYFQLVDSLQNFPIDLASTKIFWQQKVIRSLRTRGKSKDRLLPTTALVYIYGVVFSFVAFLFFSHQFQDQH